MPLDLSEILVVAVSSRALFDLERENEIFEKEGIKAFRKYEQDNEDMVLSPGTAFHIVKSLLELNQQATKRIVEVVIMSRNSPETGMRVLKSVEKHGLDISRMAFTGGEPLAPYIDAYDIDLFLSKDATDVQRIIDSKNCAAALIYSPPEGYQPDNKRVKIAFDADAVVFSEDSEIVYKKHGLEAFHKHEKEHENEALKEGPFANLIRKLSKIQENFTTGIELSPLRIAIVTARNAPAHVRIIKTLREWGVYVDEIYFLGGLPKDKVLRTFGAHIFFDDQDGHLKDASKVVPSGRVPYTTDSQLKMYEGENGSGK